MNQDTSNSPPMLLGFTWCLLTSLSFHDWESKRWAKEMLPGAHGTPE